LRFRLVEVAERVAHPNETGERLGPYERGVAVIVSMRIGKGLADDAVAEVAA
jgi:hypothetical protein